MPGSHDYGVNYIPLAAPLPREDDQQSARNLYHQPGVRYCVNHPDSVFQGWRIMQRATVWASIVLQLLVASAAFADCVEIGPICQHFWQHDLVFDGTVTRIDRAIAFE
jgi:hypothetical protein